MKPFIVTNDYMKIDEAIDYSNENHPVDVLSIDLVHIKGDLRQTKDAIVVKLSVTGTLMQACAKTLKPVKVALQFDADILFSNNDNGDFSYQEISSLYQIIYGYLMMEKPFSVFHQDADDVSFEKVKEGHPAFLALKNK